MTPASSASSGHAHDDVAPVRNLPTTGLPSATATARSSRAAARPAPRGISRPRANRRRRLAPPLGPTALSSGHVHLRPGQHSSAGDVPGVTTGPHDEADREWTSGHCREVCRGGGRHEQRTDAPGIRTAAVSPVTLHGHVERGIAGREDGGVVDESGEEVRRRRRHAVHPTESEARCPPARTSTAHSDHLPLPADAMTNLIPQVVRCRRGAPAAYPLPAPPRSRRGELMAHYAARAFRPSGSHATPPPKNAGPHGGVGTGTGELYYEESAWVRRVSPPTAACSTTAISRRPSPVSGSGLPATCRPRPTIR